jgi:hypothetical protein
MILFNLRNNLLKLFILITINLWMLLAYFFTLPVFLSDLFFLLFLRNIWLELISFGLNIKGRLCLSRRQMVLLGIECMLNLILKTVSTVFINLIWQILVLLQFSLILVLVLPRVRWVLYFILDNFLLDETGSRQLWFSHKVIIILLVLYTHFW